MASVDELSASIEAAKDAIEQNTSVVAAAMQQAEELSGQLAAVGVEGKSAQAMQVKDSLEQIHTQLAGLQSAAEQVRAQAEAMRALQGGTGGGVAVGDAIGGKEVPTPAGLIGGGRGADGPPKAELPPPAAGTGEPSENSAEPPKFTFSGLYVPDPDLTKKIGELWDPPEPVDLEEDRTRTKTASLGRNLIRNGEDIHAAGKNFGDTLGKLAQSDYDPLHGAVAETASDTNPVVFQPPPRPELGGPDLGSVIGTGLMVASVAVDAVGRFMEARERKE